jgi:hypothetical protein
MLKKESKYSFLYQAHDGSIMRPESFLNINGGRTLSSSQLRTLRINKIKNTSFKRQAASRKQQASSAIQGTHSKGRILNVKERS